MSRGDIAALATSIVLALARFADASLQSPAVSTGLATPLRVCTASIQDFGARCDGAPSPEFTDPSLTPKAGWCPGYEINVCGYDIDMFYEAALRVGLRSTDYVHVCMGELGFTELIDNLAGRSNETEPCDIGVSAITITTEREGMGLRFSRPVLNTKLAAMTYTPPRRYGNWAFLRPLSVNVWLALLATVALTPLMIFAVDVMFSNANNYVVVRYGRIQVARSLGDIAWACMSHVLLLDYMQANSLPARVILVGFGLLIFTVTNTYTASLVAVLTTEVASTPIDPAQLARMRVATMHTYAGRVAQRTRASVTDVSRSLNYTALVEKLRVGRVDAVVSDMVQLQALAALDDSCALTVTPLDNVPFDTGFAYRPGFPRATIEIIDNSLLALKQRGVYERAKLAHMPPETRCMQLDANASQQVQLRALRGLWVVMGLAYLASTLAAVFAYARARVAGAQHASDLDKRALALTGRVPASETSVHSINERALRAAATIRKTIHASADASDGANSGGATAATAASDSSYSYTYMEQADTSISNIMNTIENIESYHRGLHDVMADEGDIVPSDPECTVGSASDASVLRHRSQRTPYPA